MVRCLELSTKYIIDVLLEVVKLSQGNVFLISVEGVLHSFDCWGDRK